MHKLEEVIAFLNPNQSGIGVPVVLVCHEVGERIGTTVAYVGGGVMLKRAHDTIWVNFHDVITARLQKS